MLRMRGVTLIELAVALAIMAVLLAVAIPSFSGMIQNSRIRNQAGSIVNGLSIAKAEAVKRNAIVRFQLVTSLDDSCVVASTATGWVVSLLDAKGRCGAVLSAKVAPMIIQRQAPDTTGTLAVSSNEAFVAFNGLGRLVVNSTGASINVNTATGACATSATSDGARCMRINIAPGGGIRMCDPILSSDNIQSCDASNSG